MSSLSAPKVLPSFYKKRKQRKSRDQEKNLFKSMRDDQACSLEASPTAPSRDLFRNDELSFSDDEHANPHMDM